MSTVSEDLHLRSACTSASTTVRQFQASLLRYATLALACVCLNACGGGGGGSANPPPSPQPPTQPPSTPVAGGCSVTVTDGPFELVWPRVSWETRSPESQGLCPDELEEASNYAFATGNATGAVLVIKNGYIVFERYSEDRDQQDLVTSWSVAKSITSALMGIALEEERISALGQSVGTFVEAWDDGKKADITIDHMMTLRTALTEPNAAEFYNAADQLAMAVQRELVGDPGEQHIGYSNADVMVAGEVIEQSTGMSAQEYFDLRIGQTIGLAGEWWTDEGGNVLTYCCMDSTARDFARFGVLFSRNGVWIEEQVVPSGWIEYSQRPARENARYSYYWWPVARGGVGAFGLQGQMIVIYPEFDLVVLRFTRYTRRGDGRAVRTPTNYHDTPAPQNFDNATFLTLARDAVPN